MADEDEYINSIPEAYRDVESIRDAGSMENLLNQHVNLEKKMGTAVFSPGEDADDEQWGSFYNKVNELAPGLTRIPDGDDLEGFGKLYSKLGRPDGSEGYEIPEIKYNDKALDQGDVMDGFREEAHKMGLSGAQFKGIINYFGGETVKQMETADQARTDLMGELTNEWGDATDSRLQRISELVTEQGGEEALAALGELRRNPIILNMLDKMADSMMEEGSLGNLGPAGDAATRAGIEDEIATLKANEAFLDNKNTEHGRTVSRIDALYKKLETFKQKAA